MWYFILLVVVTLSTAIELRHGTYLLDIDDGILKSIKPTESNSDVDLSSLKLRTVDKNAFDTLTSAKSINLRNNSIESLPEFVFANLTNLERLSLAENKLSSFENTFVGLTNLKLLNISFNPLRHLRKSYLFGLTKSADIVVEGNELWSISRLLFENPFLRDSSTVDDEPKVEREGDEEPKSPSLRNGSENDDSVTLNENLLVKICKADGLVTSVEELKANETLSNDCSRAVIHYQHRKLILSSLGLKAFKKDWYKLSQYPFNSIDLTHNDITEVTPELLNDLPSDLAYVNLANNKIEKLRKNIIKNDHLKMLNLKNNFITAIEDGALEKTKLSGFFAIGNRLRNLGFASTLPSTITEMIVSQNEITEMPADALAKLKNLVYLNLAHNNITELNSRSLAGLPSLQVLILTDNRLSEIRPGAFDDLISLRTLYLYRNSLTDLENGVFRGLDSLKDLNLAWNNLTKVTPDYFHGLPDTLRELHLDFNQIASLDAGSFVGVPKFTLSLDGNRISDIPRGTFDLPHLHELHLKNNLLETINGDSYEGLPRLRRLLLNGNKIGNIRKGAAKNMVRLHILDISKNPIERLENGALFGLPKIKPGAVYVSDTQLRVIQGGIFEDL